MSRRLTADVLAAALELALARHLGPLRNLHHKWTDWQSATFVGARHDLRFVLDTDVAKRLEAIGDAELTLTCGFVAEAVVVTRLPNQDDLTVGLEILTIAD